MQISYKATFIKQYNKLDENLQEEILEVLEEDMIEEDIE
jgi:hypothetical protein